MTEKESFADLIRLVRSGDEQAARRLVEDFEPEIRRAVRVRLTEPELRRIIDSADICQSVLGSFFVRAGLGQYDLQGPQDLLRLFISMARNKLADVARRETAQRRDRRRQRPLDDLDREIPDPGLSPSARLASKETLDALRERLSDEERRIAAWRAAGRQWADIAGEIGGTPEGLRKRLKRAIDRVAAELGLEDEICDGD